MYLSLLRHPEAATRSAALAALLEDVRHSATVATAPLEEAADAATANGTRGGDVASEVRAAHAEADGSGGNTPSEGGGGDQQESGSGTGQQASTAAQAAALAARRALQGTPRKASGTGGSGTSTELHGLTDPVTSRTRKLCAGLGRAPQVVRNRLRCSLVYTK